LARVRTTGRGDAVEMRGSAGQGGLTVTASLFKQVKLRRYGVAPTHRLQL
jgi:hypothetical protein